MTNFLFYVVLLVTLFIVGCFILLATLSFLAKNKYTILYFASTSFLFPHIIINLIQVKRVKFSFCFEKRFFLNIALNCYVGTKTEQR